MMENSANQPRPFYLKYSNIALINLAVVATIGVIMRYKIGFDFPFLDQKNLQHAHSHFAFGGWVTLVLYLFVSHFVENAGINSPKYKYLIACQYLTSLGMLFSFAIGGYNTISIILSTATVLISYLFLWIFIKDKKKLNQQGSACKWYEWGLIFQVLSSLGTFSLAYMMATHQFHQHGYLASVFFFLHFQYNGWFLFGIIGASLHFLRQNYSIDINDSRAFRFLRISVVPAYGLSVLWLDLFWPVYLIVVAFVILQSIGIVALLNQFWHIRKEVLPKLSLCVKWGSLFSGSAFLLKFLFQLISLIPALSQLAFGFRPVVIAYLHLALLAASSVSILTLLIGMAWIKSGKLGTTGFLLLLLGIFLNELGLGIQGAASFDYIMIPGMNPYLFVVACLILIALLMLLAAQFRQVNNQYHV